MYKLLRFVFSSMALKIKWSKPYKFEPWYYIFLININPRLCLPTSLGLSYLVYYNWKSDSLHCQSPKNYNMIFFFVTTLIGPHFLDCVFPFVWLDVQVKGILKCLLTFLNNVSLSPTLMACSKVSLVHLPLIFIGLHLLTLHYIFFGFAKEGGTFSLFCFTNFISHFTSYKAHLISLWFKSP